MPAPLIMGAAAIAARLAAKKAAQTAIKKAATKKAAAVAAKKAAASARGLKAAKGPSMAPKGYTADTARREALLEARKIKYPMGSYTMSLLKQAQAVSKGAAPKNVISKSGRVANTPKLMKKAAKKK